MILDWFVHHKRFGRFKTAFDRQSLPTLPLSSFPRCIHIYWDQGFEQAPEIVQACLRSWQEKNPGWQIVTWDAASANKLLDRSSLPADLKIAHYTDIFRTLLLLREGGLWADATLFCNRPLDDWILQIMAQCQFFAFCRPGPDREISNWFLAGRPNALILRMLRDAVGQFWQERPTSTRVYHWHHYIFEYLERTSRAFRREWRNAPRLSAAPMLKLQEQLVAGTEPSAEDIELYRALPLHKLTHKRPIDLQLLGRVLG